MTDDVALVSIVMPVHNAVRYLDEAIASLHAQDWAKLELVAVDDGSTDGSGARLEKIATGWNDDGRRMRILTQDRRGAAAARNTGVAAADGDLILLADADDRVDPDLVRASMAVLSRDPTADVVCGRCRYIDADGSTVTVQGQQPQRPTIEDLLRGVMVNTPLLRRAAGEGIGWHDEAMEGSIDTDLLVRLLLQRPGCLVFKPDVLSDYRRSDGQITSDWRRMRRSWETIVAKVGATDAAPDPATLSRLKGHHCVYWSTLAYLAGEYPAARRLLLEALRLSPGHVVQDPEARIRAAACAASLLPDRMHAALRDAFNRRRAAPE